MSLAATALLYLPGLAGPFLFDDKPNLVRPLGRWLHGDVSAASIVMGNHSGALGRSLSMLTFLGNAALGGLAPLPFKLTNLAIHLICGALIFRIIQMLLRRSERSARLSDIAAWSIATAWLVHPIQVSTVLYVVQRMAQLSALFVLVALLVYIHGRTLLEKGARTKALVYLFVLVPLCTLLAALSKENGVLAPLLCGVIEVGYFRPAQPSQKRPRSILAFFSLFLLIPGVAGAIRFLLPIQRLANSYAGRPFTLSERLLSEARVLVDYMVTLLFPRSSALGLYTDDFIVSHSLTSPPGTLPAILFLALLVTAAWRWRLRNPAFFTGIFFYLAGQALESTIFPLELYFEHRNYLPSVGFFLAVAGLLMAGARYVSKFNLRPAKLAPVALLILCALGLATSARAYVWSSWPAIAQQGIRHHPDSLRAHLDLASILLENGQLSETQAVVNRLAQSSSPTSRHFSAIYTALLQCLAQRHAEPGTVDRIRAIAGSKLLLSDMLSFDMLGQVVNAKPCENLGPATLAAIIARTATEARQPLRLIQIWRMHYMAARLYASAGDLQKARDQAAIAWQTTASDAAVGMDLAGLEFALGNRAEAAAALTSARKRISRWDARGMRIAAKMERSYATQQPARPSLKASPTP